MTENSYGALFKVLIWLVWIGVLVLVVLMLKD